MPEPVTWLVLLRDRALYAAIDHAKQFAGQELRRDGWDMTEYRRACFDLRVPLSYQAALWPHYRRSLGRYIEMIRAGKLSFE